MVVMVAKPDPGGKPGETAFAAPTETLQHVCPELRVSDVCPYRNLEAFTEADTAFFFGRERIIDEMVNSLREESRFLAVLGPSGCGKSSVVQAGLVPSLRGGAVDGSDRWEIIVTRPTDPSFASLLMTLSQSPAAVWDAPTFAYEGVVTGVAFSPDGHLLAIADLKGSIAVWDISNGYRLTTFFSHEGAITAVTFSLDGYLLITASKDKTVRIWPWRPDELMSDACSRLTRNLTLEEWRWYIGDEPYRRTCANLP